MHYKTKYEAIPELEALRKEIGSYKYWAASVGRPNVICI